MLDKKLNTRIFTSLSGLIVSIFIYLSINYAYEHPYRLTSNIAKQVEEVSLLGGLSVDIKTKHYIEGLEKISNSNKLKNEKISLIDMTGGTPGANVILNAEFFGHQWLIGAYKGSNQMLERILKPYQNTIKLKNAWILLAPDGARKLDLNILNNIGLDFPNSYIKIGTVKTAHRHEVQELWKPKISF
jgi:hypothetical protein